MRPIATLAFALYAGVSYAQLANFTAADRFAFGIGDNLPAPYTQLDMTVTLEVRVGVFWVPYTNEIGVDEAVVPKTPGSNNFSLPLSTISTLFASSQPLLLSGVASGNTMTWTFNQVVSQPGGFPINTTFDNNGTPVVVSVTVNSMNVVGSLRSTFASQSPLLVNVLQTASDVRGTYTGGDTVNFIDATAGSASGTVGGVPINGLRIRYRRIQHISHVPMDLKLTGTISRQDLAPNAPSFSAQMQLLPQTGTTVLASANVTASANGQYSWSPLNVLPGTYRLRVDHGSHLARTVQVTLGSNAAVNVSLPNGDVNSDGEVDLTDIDLAIADYLTSTWQTGRFSDVDRSGEVDLTDLDIIIGNYLNADN